MVSNISFYSLLSIILPIIFSGVLESEAVLKGENAQPGDFPSIVSFRNSSGGHYCAGTLVTRKHIVTAAHCLYDDVDVFFVNGTGEMLNPENVKVLVGTVSSKQSDGDLYEVEKFIQHPEYDIKAAGIYIHDVAVVILKREVDTKNVIRTPFSVALPKDNALGYAAGWGLLSYDRGYAPVDQYDYPTQLQKLSVTIKDKVSCVQKYETKKGLRDLARQIDTGYLICAQPVVDGAGMCLRDSGSPLIVDGQFVGHIVAGVPCGRGFPDLFLSTADHQDFISVSINV